MSCLEFASLQLSASLAVCRGFPLDRKGNEGRKKGKKMRLFLSLCAGVLADVISKYAALIAPLGSSKGRGDLPCFHPC